MRTNLGRCKMCMVSAAVIWLPASCARVAEAAVQKVGLPENWVQDSIFQYVVSLPASMEKIFQIQGIDSWDVFYEDAAHHFQVGGGFFINSISGYFQCGNAQLAPAKFLTDWGPGRDFLLFKANA